MTARTRLNQLLFASLTSMSILMLPLGAAMAKGQEPSDAAKAASKHRMIVDLVVTDQEGNPATGLSGSDFTLTDNGQTRKLLGFIGVNQPGASGASAAQKSGAEVMIVIDTLNTGTTEVSYARAQIELFLRRSNGKLDYPVSLYMFKETGLLQVGSSTRDGNSLADSLEKIEAYFRPYRGSQAFYGALERMELSVKTLDSLATDASKRPGRKIMLWLGPGWPFLQATDAESDAKQSKKIFEAAVAISAALRQARMSVYSIDINQVPGANQQGFLRYTVYSKPVTKWKSAAIGNVSVQVLALQSGGLPINSPGQILSEQISSLVSSATTGYALMYEQASASEKDEFHEIKVAVDMPGLKLRHQAGYYAEP